MRTIILIIAAFVTSHLSAKAQDTGLPLRQPLFAIADGPCAVEVFFNERVQKGNFIAVDWYHRPTAPFPLVCQISDAFGRQVQQLRYRIDETSFPVLADLQPGPYTLTMLNEQNVVVASCDFDINSH